MLRLPLKEDLPRGGCLAKGAIPLPLPYGIPHVGWEVHSTMFARGLRRGEQKNREPLREPNMENTLDLEHIA